MQAVHPNTTPIDRKSPKSGKSLFFSEYSYWKGDAGQHYRFEWDGPVCFETLSVKKVDPATIDPAHADEKSLKMSDGDFSAWQQENPDTLPTVRAEWVPKEDQKRVRKVLRDDMSSLENANIFGDSGLLLLDPSCAEDFRVFTADEFVEKGLERVFGVRIFGAGPGSNAVHSRSPAFVADSEVRLMALDFAQEYAEEFLFVQKTGCGIPVETHPFPHMLQAARVGDTLQVIVGRRLSGTDFVFARVNLGVEHACWLESNTIHGDALSVGSFAMLVEEKSDADAVFIRDQEGGLVKLKSE